MRMTSLPYRHLSLFFTAEKAKLTIPPFDRTPGLDWSLIAARTGSRRSDLSDLPPGWRRPLLSSARSRHVLDEATASEFYRRVQAGGGDSPPMIKGLWRGGDPARGAAASLARRAWHRARRRPGRFAPAAPVSAARHPGRRLRAMPLPMPVGTKGWPCGSNKGMNGTAAGAYPASAATSPPRPGSNRVRWVSMAQATARSRSATLRSARPCVQPRALRAA